MAGAPGCRAGQRSTDHRPFPAAGPVVEVDDAQTGHQYPDPAAGCHDVGRSGLASQTCLCQAAPSSPHWPPHRKGSHPSRNFRFTLGIRPPRSRRFGSCLSADSAVIIVIQSLALAQQSITCMLTVRLPGRRPTGSPLPVWLTADQLAGRRESVYMAGQIALRLESAIRMLEDRI